MHKDTEMLVAAAHECQEFHPSVIKEGTDALLDLLEKVEVAARHIERCAGEVGVLAAAGGEDEGVAGAVALYRSKAGVLLRDARKLRDPLLDFRRHTGEFQRADRQIRASLKKAGEDVPDDDLSARDLSAAPDIRGDRNV